MPNLLASFKASVKRRAPWLVPPYSYVVWRFVIRPRWRRLGMDVFSEHYRRNGWGKVESASGEGSSYEQTAAVRQALPAIVRDFEVRTLLDAPCGDFNWLRSVDLPVRYVGIDVVQALIDSNQRRFANDSRSFVRLDLTRDPLPAVDLVLCRDCLFHFSYADIHKALANIKRSGARLLLTTTNPSLAANRDIVTGEWRRLNLQAPPFSLPAPLMLVDERCPSPYAPDKHLALWRIADL
jgi:SAM-dependent methyltransferase